MRPIKIIPLLIRGGEPPHGAHELVVAMGVLASRSRPTAAWRARNSLQGMQRAGRIPPMARR